MRIVYLDPVTAFDPPARARRRRTPGWMVALGVVVYCSLAWAVVLTVGAGLWDRLGPKTVFAASHRG